MVFDIVCALGIFSGLIGLGNIIIGICEDSYNYPLASEITKKDKDLSNNVQFNEYEYLKTLTPEEQDIYYRNYSA